MSASNNKALQGHVDEKMGLGLPRSKGSDSRRLQNRKSGKEEIRSICKEERREEANHGILLGYRYSFRNNRK